MTLSKKTNYPATISVSPAQYRALNNGKFKKVKITCAKTGATIKIVTNIAGLLSSARPIVQNDLETVKYYVLRFA